jgi:predicted RNase H-like HicB family nuclease
METYVNTYILRLKTEAKSYVFKAATEKDEEDEERRWSSWIEALPGCAAWGYSEAEALKDCAAMYVEDMLETEGCLSRGRRRGWLPYYHGNPVTLPSFLVRRLRNIPAHRRTRGSGRLYQHPDGRRASIHYHSPSQTFSAGTLRNVLRGTRWTEEDLRRLGFI